MSNSQTYEGISDLISNYCDFMEKYKYLVFSEDIIEVTSIIMNYFQEMGVPEDCLPIIIFHDTHISMQNKINSKTYNILDISKKYIRLYLNTKIIKKTFIKKIDNDYDIHATIEDKYDLKYNIMPFDTIDIFISILKNIHYVNAYNEIISTMPKGHELHNKSMSMYVYGLELLNYIKKLNKGYPEIKIENDKHMGVEYLTFKTDEMIIKLEYVEACFSRICIYNLIGNKKEQIYKEAIHKIPPEGIFNYIDQMMEKD